MFIRLLLLVLAGWWTGCDENSSVTGAGDHYAEAEFTRAVAVSPGASFRLDALNGSIEVRGSGAPGLISIRALRRVGADSQAEADAGLSDLQIDIDSTGAEQLLVSTIQPRTTAGRNYTVEYTIVVPAQTPLLLGQANGEVQVNSVQADIDVRCANGRVDVHQCSGNVDVILSNGEIHAALAPPPATRVSLQVANGTIALELDDATSANLSASAVNGLVSIRGLPFAASLQTTRAIRGVLGDGSGSITLSAANGMIDISAD